MIPLSDAHGELLAAEPAGASSTNNDGVVIACHEFHDPDEIEQFLVQAYDTAMRIRSDDDHWLLRHRRVATDIVAVDAAEQSADLRFEIAPLRKLVVTATGTSRFERTAGRHDRRYGPGELFIQSEPGLPYTARWLPGDIHNYLIDLALFGQVAAATGRHPQRIKFTSLDPVTDKAAELWRTTRDYVTGVLNDPDAAAAPLLVASAAQLLAAATLETFPNTATTDPAAQDRRDAHTATLRRAISFIDDNAHRDISPADVAAAAHVTIRALQLAFRRHLDCTPTEYLRRVRLFHAHRDLVNGTRLTDTVTDIAYRWGFPSPGRFAVYYRMAYGVSPLQTLRED